MELTVRLLGEVNRAVDGTASVRSRHIAAITASQLSSILSFDRTGERKADRFRIRPESFIQVDEEIQRGKDTSGNLLQLPAKVEDIANTLLGKDKAVAPRAFLGTLIWNVRPSPGNSIVTIAESVLGSAGPPEYKLKLNADHIFLTDSAHRHLGIVHAFRRYQANPALYPRFRPECEFVVELYQLDRAEEKALFFELNAMQKRITAAKRKEMDSVSSAGFVKDAVRDYDSANRGLFKDNIEVTSNMNVNHTLMTMSLFVSSIHEMFPKLELDEGKTSDVKRAELAEYYCQFFYKLSDSIVVQVDDPVSGQVLSVRPFGNLYSELIQPVLDEGESADAEEVPGVLEDKLEAARHRAKSRNLLIRSQDVANHNTTIKALCRVARMIRPMAKWESVVDYLQTKLNTPGGRFFQRSNPELMAADAQLLKLNEDGSVNLQVQTHTLNAMTRYLRRKLLLELPPSLRWIPADPEVNGIEVTASSTPTVPLTKNGASLNFEVAFFLAGDELPEDSVRLSVKLASDSFDWKAMTLTGAKRLVPTAVRRDAGYAHPVYDRDVARYVAEFSLETGKVPNSAGGEIPVVLTFSGFDLDGVSKIESEHHLKLLLT